MIDLDQKIGLLNLSFSEKKITRKYSKFHDSISKKSPESPSNNSSIQKTGNIEFNSPKNQIIENEENQLDDLLPLALVKRGSFSKSMRSSLKNQRKKSILGENPENSDKERRSLMRQRRSTFVEHTIKDQKIKLYDREDRKRIIKNIFDVNINYELFKANQERAFSDGEWNKIKKYNIQKEEEEEDDKSLFFSDTCYERTNILDSITQKTEINIFDFEFLKLISKGAYGRVWQVRRKVTGDIYAMKIVNFAEKVKKNY